MVKRTPVPKMSALIRTVLESSPVIDVEAVPRDQTRPPDRLRWEARAVYIMHPDGVTVEEISQHAAFVGRVSLSQMRAWCSEDGWVEERKAVLAKLGDKIAADLQTKLWSKLAKVRSAQLTDVGKLKAYLMTEILGKLEDGSEGAGVKSAESAAKVVVEIMKHELELTANIAKELSPRAGGGQIEPRSGATDEEVRELAVDVLRRRRMKAAPSAALAAPLEEAPLPFTLLRGEETEG